jgi:hypothetical protein
MLHSVHSASPFLRFVRPIQENVSYLDWAAYTPTLSFYWLTPKSFQLKLLPHRY